jgi:hypothetical protein
MGNNFPNELLKQSNFDRKQYFVNYTSAHPVLKAATDELLDVIFGSTPSSIVLVYGPSGVGKTTLRKRIEIQLTEALQESLETDRSRLPYVSVDAVAASSGNFSWRDFFRRMLIQMNEPCVDQKLMARHELMLSSVSSKASEATLRFAAERALQFRRPLALLIDEAQHIGKISSGRKLHDQLDTIKSLSIMSGVTIVLIGTYELLPFRNLSGQLSRRSVDIHLGRYDARLPSDVEAFRNVLFAFQNHLPLWETPDFVGPWQFLYERSTGSVGVLKDWLIRGFHGALKDGGKVMTQSHLEKTALSIAQLKRMLADNLEGERQLKEADSGREMFQQQLGLRVSDALEYQIKNKQVKSAAFKRKPHRDPVGVPNVG